MIVKAYSDCKGVPLWSALPSLGHMHELRSLGFTQLRAKLCASCADHCECRFAYVSRRNSKPKLIFPLTITFESGLSVSIRQPLHVCVIKPTQTNGQTILVIIRSLNDFSVMPRKLYLRRFRTQFFHSLALSFCLFVSRLFDEFMNSNQMNATTLELFVKLCMESLCY